MAFLPANLPWVETSIFLPIQLLSLIFLGSCPHDREDSEVWGLWRIQTNDYDSVWRLRGQANERSLEGFLEETGFERSACMMRI